MSFFDYSGGPLCSELLRPAAPSGIDPLRLLAASIRAADYATKGHCSRVRLLSMGLCDGLDLSDEEIAVVGYGSLLHDIGKIGVPRRLLIKSGRLTAEENRIVNLHPVIGDRILESVGLFQACRPIVLQHHERFDGSGYPRGALGERIDRLARIVTIADSFDAMTSRRPYHTPVPLEQALAELERGKGSQFDPDMVDVFLDRRVYAVLTSARRSIPRRP